MSEPETPETGILIHPDGSTSTEPAALPVEERPVAEHVWTDPISGALLVVKSDGEGMWFIRGGFLIDPPEGAAPYAAELLRVVEELRGARRVIASTLADVKDREMGPGDFISLAEDLEAYLAGKEEADFASRQALVLSRQRDALAARVRELEAERGDAEDVINFPTKIVRTVPVTVAAGAEKGAELARYKALAAKRGDALVRLVQTYETEQDAGDRDCVAAWRPPWLTEALDDLADGRRATEERERLSRLDAFLAGEEPPEGLFLLLFDHEGAKYSALAAAEVAWRWFREALGVSAPEPPEPLGRPAPDLEEDLDEPEGGQP